VSANRSWIQQALRASAKRLRLGVSGERNAELLEQIEATLSVVDDALQLAARHCPCGARPESPLTHPHVPGCKIAAALTVLAGFDQPPQLLGATVCGYTPGKARVELQLESSLPDWLELGQPVHVVQRAPREA